MKVWQRGVDLYRTSEVHCFIRPRTFTPGTRYGVIFGHGVGQGGDNFVRNPGSLTDKLWALADAGYPVMTADLSAATYAGANWGNTDHIAAVGAAYTYLTTAGEAKPGRVFVFGSSMGTLALNWVRQNKALVAAFAASIPVLDPNDIYVNDKAGHRVTLEAAWAVTYPAPLTATPALYQPVYYAAGDLSGLPVRLWPSANDPIASPTAQCQTWDGAGAVKTVTDLGNVGHDPTVMQPQQLVGFFDANGGRN